MSPRTEREAAMADFAVSQVHPAVLGLSTPALLHEVDAGLALRVCRRQTTARDVLLVQALADRLRGAPVRGYEPLEGMLLLDLVDERRVSAPVLRFDGVERRVA